ncbi:MAG: hypothetical protein WBQ55_06885, partial [Xanthobacteraceae bacterium]
INVIRAHLAEFGIVAPVGRNGVEQLLGLWLMEVISDCPRLHELSFFQYFENNFPTDANTAFSTPEGQHFQEMNEVYPILRRCFVDIDLQNRNDIAIETYSAEHPQSPWIPLVKACTSYSRRRYASAVQLLDDDFPPDTAPEFRTTYLFFRGVNRLKVYTSERFGVVMA